MSIPFTAALFAGRRRSTLDGDPVSLLWKGQPLWEKQIQLLESLQPEQILISGQADGPYTRSNHQLLPLHEGKLGPLAGLNDLISICTTPRLLVLDVSMPWMTGQILQQLLSFEGGVVPESKSSLEATTAVYPSDILPLVRNTLQSPDRSLEAFLRLAINNGFIDTWSIPADTEQCFNIWDGSSVS